MSESERHRTDTEHKLPTGPTDGAEMADLVARRNANAYAAAYEREQIDAAHMIEPPL